jgi:MFS family permease
MEGRITPTQWRALVAAWLGWAFDGLDGYLYVLVAAPFVGQLLGKPPTDPEVARKGALIQAAFLVGWAVGGAVFGRIGDRIGRSRTLTLTVLTYAMFTGLSYFAGSWWHLLIFRFVAALGIGGEWAAGSALVAETLHLRHRAWASATLQSGYMVGMLAAIATTRLFATAPRSVFLVGIVPALLTLWIRFAVPEPAEWHAAVKGRRIPPVRALFARGLARTTILTFLLTGIALTTVWGFLFFAPQVIRAMPELRDAAPATKVAMVVRITTVYVLVNIAANYAATYTARALGYRRTLAIMFVGAGATFLIGFARPASPATIYWTTSAASLFALGVFGIFPLYIPPLFPTLLRTLGAGVTYNTGRLVAAVGTFNGGLIAAGAGEPNRAIFWLGLLYSPGVVVALMMPEGGQDTGAA